MGNFTHRSWYIFNKTELREVLFVSKIENVLNIINKFNIFNTHDFKLYYV